MNKFKMGEFDSHTSTKPDPLIEELLRIEGVPDVLYRVEGENVFVFDALLSILKNSKLPTDPVAREEALRIIVPSLLPTACVSAKEAVTVYGVEPDNYGIEEGIRGFYVKNYALKSIIPVPSSSEKEARLLLADVLMGKRVPTEYDALIGTKNVITDLESSIFAFGDQVFENIKNSFDEFEFTLPETGSFFLFNGQQDAMTKELTSTLVNPYREGCLLVPKDKYSTMLENATQWFFDGDYAIDVSYAHHVDPQAWGKLFSSFSFEPVDEKSGLVLDAGQKKLVGLIRSEFPEITGVPDFDVLELYLDFYRDENDTNLISESDIFRDDDYLFFIIGEQCQRGIASARKMDNIDIGAIAAYFVKTGRSGEDATLLVREYVELTSNMNAVMWDCHRLFHYIDTVNAQGGKITSGQKVTEIPERYVSSKTIKNALEEVTQSLSKEDIYQKIGMSRTKH